MDFNRDRYWLSICRIGCSSEDDNFIFRIWPKAWGKNKHADSMPKFIDGKNLEDARTKAHGFIDKMFDEYRKVDYLNRDKNDTPPPPPLQPPDCDSLQIGGDIPSEKKPDDNQGMLLDLKDLV